MKNNLTLTFSTNSLARSRQQTVLLLNLIPILAGNETERKGSRLYTYNIANVASFRYLTVNVGGEITYKWQNHSFVSMQICLPSNYIKG